MSTINALLMRAQQTTPAPATTSAPKTKAKPKTAPKNKAKTKTAPKTKTKPSPWQTLDKRAVHVDWADRPVNIYFKGKRDATGTQYLIAWGKDAYSYITETDANRLRTGDDASFVACATHYRNLKAGAPQAPQAPQLQPHAPQAPQAPQYTPRERAPIVDAQGRDIRPATLPAWSSPEDASPIGWADLMTWGCSRIVGESMRDSWALLWLSMIARRPIMLRGLPGSAKSMLAEMMGSMMAGARHGIVQMHPTASAEELLGAQSLRALDHDLIARSFGDAPIASHLLMIDEFEKASEPTQQALLSLLAERVLRDAGRTFELPIEGIVATSNDEIYDDAVRDRFTLTAWSERHKPSAFRRAYRSLSPTHTEERVTSGQLAQWRELQERAIASQDDPRLSGVWGVIDEALDHCSEVMSADGNEEGLSERRTLQAIDLMGAVAASRGRDYILISDAVILQWLPPSEAQQAQMRTYIASTMRIIRCAGYHAMWHSSLEEQIDADYRQALEATRGAMAHLDRAFS